MPRSLECSDERGWDLGVSHTNIHAPFAVYTCSQSISGGQGRYKKGTAGDVGGGFTV